MRRWIVPLLLPLVGATLVVAGVIYGGQALRWRLRHHDRYTVPFSEIDCIPPEGIDRARFLAEVRDQSGLPEALPVLDDDLPAHLSAAFRRNPWVEDVEEAKVVQGKQVQVRLRYRTPVLAVPLTGEMRCVDGTGVMLPKEASVAGLPVWRGPASVPPKHAGEVWGDGPLEAAAQVVGLLHDYQSTLHLAAARTANNEVTLTTVAGSRILWGHVEGKEKEGEAAASVKLERLLDHARGHGDLDHPDGPYEHDVRSADKARVRALRNDR
jgi:hypothetical protein